MISRNGFKSEERKRGGANVRRPNIKETGYTRIWFTIIIFFSEENHMVIINNAIQWSKILNEK